MEPDQIAAAEDAVVGLERDVTEMIERRADRRGDDLISALLDVEDQGDRLTHDETVTIVGNLIVGGHDTTASQAGCTLLTMLRHPELGAAIRATTATPASVVDETIRFDPSIDVVPRTLIEPVEIAGEARPAGTIVLLSSASASRDAAVWSDPDEIVPARFDAPDAPKLLTFGSGPHYCLGAALARMTLQEVATEFARVEEQLTALGDLDHVEWRQVLGRSPASLPVRSAA